MQLKVLMGLNFFMDVASGSFGIRERTGKDVFHFLLPHVNCIFRFRGCIPAFGNQITEIVPKESPFSNLLLDWVGDDSNLSSTTEECGRSPI
jgi:hypothetical protein